MSNELETEFKGKECTVQSIFNFTPFQLCFDLVQTKFEFIGPTGCADGLDDVVRNFVGVVDMGWRSMFIKMDPNAV